jgi:hypothetical protein
MSMLSFTTSGLQTWSQSTPSSGGQVNIMVAGMRGFTTYHMRAVAVFPDGTEFNDADHTFATGGLSPSQTPSMTTTTTPGMTPSGGVELLDLVHSGSPGPQENVVATDLNGNVIWDFDPWKYHLGSQPRQAPAGWEHAHQSQ